MAAHDYSEEKPKPKPFRPDLKRCLKGRSSCDSYPQMSLFVRFAIII